MADSKGLPEPFSSFHSYIWRLFMCNRSCITIHFVHLCTHIVF